MEFYPRRIAVVVVLKLPPISYLEISHHCPSDLVPFNVLQVVQRQRRFEGSFVPPRERGTM